MITWIDTRGFYTVYKTILYWILIGLGIAGWSSLFAADGVNIGSQHLGGIIQVWAETCEYSYPYDSSESQFTTSFELHRIRLALEGEIKPGHLEYCLDIELDDYDSQVVDAYIRWWVTRYVKVKFGRFHPAFTLYGPAPLDQLESPYYPLTTSLLGPGRQVGLEISRRSRFVQLDLGLFNGAIEYDTWRDHDNYKDVSMRVNITLLDWVDFNMQAMYGKHEISYELDGEHLLVGLSLKMDWEQIVHLRMEWIRKYSDTAYYPEYDPVCQMVSDATLIHLGYNFTPVLESLIRYEWFEEGLLPNSGSDIIDYAWQERVTLGVRYTLVHNQLTISGYYILNNYRYITDTSFGTLHDTRYNFKYGILEMQLTF